MFCWLPVQLFSKDAVYNNIEHCNPNHKLLVKSKKFSYLKVCNTQYVVYAESLEHTSTGRQYNIFEAPSIYTVLHTFLGAPSISSFYSPPPGLQMANFR